MKIKKEKLLPYILTVVVLGMDQILSKLDISYTEGWITLGMEAILYPQKKGLPIIKRSCELQLKLLREQGIKV